MVQIGLSLCDAIIMSIFIPSPMRFYKLCALIGTVIILADIGLSWVRIQVFESSVTEVFESMVRTQMEIDGLEQELMHVNKVLKLAQGGPAQTDKVEVDGIEYTDYEVERLKSDQGNLKLFLQEKKLDIVSLTSEKKHVMNEVRILFLISLMFLVMGTLLAAFGYLAWYFKVELFEDRRRKPR